MDGPLPDQIPVQLLLELEANWLDQNVNELECTWNVFHSGPS